MCPKGESLIGKYRPDVETDYALRSIREHKDIRFACWLSFSTKEAPEARTMLHRALIQPEGQAVYHAMVNRLDWNIGTP